MPSRRDSPTPRPAATDPAAAGEPQRAAESPQIYRRKLRLARPDMSQPTSIALHRPTVAEVNLSALLKNLEAVRALCPKARVLAVVKANAYGHGAVPVSRALQDAGVDFFGVALVEEGLELREAGIRGEILVMDAAYADYDELVRSKLTPIVFGEEHLEALQVAAERAGTNVRVHLKLDTGMARLGVQLHELQTFLAAVKRTPRVVIDGLVSHFSNADLPDQDITRIQLERYREALRTVREAGHPVRWRSMSNSAGLMDVPESKDGEELNLVRPGIMLYGEHPADRFESVCELSPVLTWKTRAVQVKRIPAGSPVSYGGRWVAKRETVIATLPVGYADGYSRRLTNLGEVIVRGKKAPIVGTVCMDLCMVDVTDIPGVTTEDEVVLLGSQGEETVSATSIADKSGTIAYEVFCAISARVPRLVVK